MSPLRWITDLFVKTTDRTMPLPDVNFAPGLDCEKAAIDAIDGARSAIEMHAYLFTSKPICDALIRARDTGVDVRLIVDHRSSLGHGCLINAAQNAGVTCWTDNKHPISHNKVIVIDGQRVVTGSFNWSHGADSNAENLMVLDSVQLATRYASNWGLHLAHSDIYDQKKAALERTTTPDEIRQFIEAMATFIDIGTMTFSVPFDDAAVQVLRHMTPEQVAMLAGWFNQTPAQGQTLKANFIVVLQGAKLMFSSGISDKIAAKLRSAEQRTLLIDILARWLG